MAALGTINSNDIVEGVPFGTLLTTALVAGSPLGSINSLTEPGSESEPSPSRMEWFTYAKTSGGSEYVVVLLPAGYDDPENSTKNYKTVFWWSGDGGDGNPTVVTNQAMTGSGSNWGGNFNNPNNVREVFWGTVVVKVSGVEVARGQYDGTIKGPGVNGTMNHTAAAGSFSVTFDTPPGATPTIDYLHSPTTEAGIPMEINGGDTLDNDTIVCIIHKAANNSFYNIVGHYDDPKATILSNYRVDTNRLCAAGISRGGMMVGNCVINRQSDFCCFIIAAGLISGTPNYTTLQNKGLLVVSGQNDTVVTPPNAGIMVAMNNIPDYKFYPKLVFVDGQGHTGVVWNTNCYNRNTAPVDWLDFFSLHSLVMEDQVSNFVSYAESTQDIDDWRAAKRAVSFLSDGALKTSLTTTLNNLKTTIDGTRKRWILDIGSTVSTDTNINYWVNAFTAGSSKTNFVTDTGVASTVGLSIINTLSTSPANGLYASTRHNIGGWGFEGRQFIDGAAVTTGTTGTLKWTGLNPAKNYRLDFYFVHNANPISVDTKPVIVVSGESKNIYTQCSNIKKLVFTGKVPNSSGEISFTYTDAGAGPLQLLTITEEN